MKVMRVHIEMNLSSVEQTDVLSTEFTGRKANIFSICFLLLTQRIARCVSQAGIETFHFCKHSPSCNLRTLIPCKEKLIIYKSSILPHLTYCHLVWHKGPGKRGHIVADALLPTQMFPRLPAQANVSQFAQPKKHFGQQYVRNNVSSFASSIR